MWVTKGCPRCSGDLYQERLLGEREVRCLQCGYGLKPQEIAAIVTARAGRKAPRSAARPAAALWAA